MLAVAYAVVFVVAGLGVFALGVFSWLYGRFVGAELVDFLAYKWSRHPQYLGYILWSYGFSIYAGLQPALRGGTLLPPSLPWLISTALVVAVALLEEADMEEAFGSRYARYRSKTPFLLPLPKGFSKVAALAFYKLVERWPRAGREVAVTVSAYLLAAVVASAILNVALFDIS